MDARDADRTGGQAPGIRGPRVVIAQGSHHQELEDLLDALEGEAIAYEVLETGTGEGWQVAIALRDALRARAAVTQAARTSERALGHAAPVPPTGRVALGGTAPPLYRLSHHNGTRLVLMAITFGLAIWLAFFS